MNKRILIDNVIKSMGELREYIMADEDGDDTDTNVNGDWQLNQIDNAQEMIELLFPETREDYRILDNIRSMSIKKLAIYLHSWQAENRSVEDIETLLNSKAMIDV